MQERERVIEGAFDREREGEEGERGRERECDRERENSALSLSFGLTSATAVLTARLQAHKSSVPSPFCIF